MLAIDFPENVCSSLRLIFGFCMQYRRSILIIIYNLVALLKQVVVLLLANLFLILVPFRLVFEQTAIITSAEIARKKSVKMTM